MDDTKCYVIEVQPYHCNVEMYWSNEHGWTDFKDADKFTFEESMNLRLPIDGRWRKITQWKTINLNAGRSSGT